VSRADRDFRRGSGRLDTAGASPRRLLMRRASHPHGGGAGFIRRKDDLYWKLFPEDGDHG